MPTPEQSTFRCADSWCTHAIIASRPDGTILWSDPGYFEAETTDALAVRLRAHGLKVVTYKRFVAIGYRR